MSAGAMMIFLGVKYSQTSCAWMPILVAAEFQA